MHAPCLYPLPRTYDFSGGLFKISSQTKLQITVVDDQAAPEILRMLEDVLPVESERSVTVGGFRQIVFTTIPPPPPPPRFKRLLRNKCKSPVTIPQETTFAPLPPPVDPELLPTEPEGYRIDITPKQIVVSALTDVGVYRGATTLRQFIRLAKIGQEIPTGKVCDWADLPTRGLMLDMSRGRTYTVATLQRVIDIMAEFKLNHLELYLENTFAYPGHATAWGDASAYSKEELAMVAAYAQAHHVSFTPAINTLGHFERWLKHDDYLPYAEMPEGGAPLPWGGIQKDPTGLCSTDPKVQELTRGLVQAIAPIDTAGLLNIGGDEAFDIGLGRSKEAADQSSKAQLYLDYLLRMNDACQAEGKRMVFWADMILNHPELLPKLPANCIPVNWGYESEHRFEETNPHLADSGLNFWVAPGSSSWRSFAGRTDNMRRNLYVAAQSAHRNNASGLLLTDWGDAGHWQNFPIAIPAIVYIAGLAWGIDMNPRAPVHQIDYHCFGCSGESLAEIICQLGNIYKVAGAETGNASELFKQLITPTGVTLDEKKLRTAREACTQSIKPLLETVSPTCTDGAWLVEELSHTIDLLVYAIDVLLKQDSDRQWSRIKANHTILWKRRANLADLAASIALLDPANRAK